MAKLKEKMTDLKKKLAESMQDTPKRVQWLLMAAAFVLVLILLTLLFGGADNKKADINLSIPNIISSISNMHPSLNYMNVWDLTVFQLLDAFNRLQANVMYDIDCTRVSVWGDEKKTFDVSLWYKNNYDNKD